MIFYILCNCFCSAVDKAYSSACIWLPDCPLQELCQLHNMTLRVQSLIFIMLLTARGKKNAVDSHIVG